jgi:hypothetical protein
VQGWVADDLSYDDLNYVQVICLVCAQAHLVNPKTGKVLAEDGLPERSTTPAGGHSPARSGVRLEVIAAPDP